MTYQRVLLVVCLVLGAPVVPSLANQETDGTTPTEIDSCTTITEAGDYVLTTDIVNSTEDTCIRIAADDVVFDGNGHTVDANWTVIRNETVGEGNLTEEFANATQLSGNAPNPTIERWANHGVAVNASTNVTISRLTVTDWIYGIAFVDSNGGAVTDLTARQTATGISLFRTSGVRAEGAELTNNTVGIVLDGASDSTVQDNDVNASFLDGVELFTTTGSLVSNNTIRNTSRFDGLYLRNSSENVVRANEITSNSLSGISLADGSDDNRVESNRIDRNGLNGLLVHVDSVRNAIRGNSFEANAHSGIALVDGANENTVAENTIINTTGEDTYTAQVNYSAGIVVNQSARNQVTANRMHGNAYSGIILTNDASENVLTGNAVLNTTELSVTPPDTFTSITLEHPAAILLTGSDNNSVRDAYVRDNVGWSYYSEDSTSQNGVRNLTMASIKRYNASNNSGSEFTFVEIAAVVSFEGQDTALSTNVTESMIEPDWSPIRSTPRVNEVRTSDNSSIENMSVRWYLREIPTAVVENSSDRRIRATTTSTTTPSTTTTATTPSTTTTATTTTTTTTPSAITTRN